MKIDGTLKQSFEQGFAVVLVSMIIGLSARALSLSIYLIQKGVSASALYLLGMLGIIIGVLWGLYRAFCKQYTQLEDVLLHGLVFVLIVTGLYEVICCRLLA